MANGPAPFSDIGKRAKELLYKDYNFDHKFSLSIPNSTGLGLIATGLKKDQVFVGDISTLYKSGNTTVDVKVDTYSNVSTKVTVNDVLHGTKAALSFSIPDHKSGKLDVQYLHPHAAIDSSIGLNPSPLLELSAAIGSKDLCLGAEVGFNTTSASFTKYNAGVAFNKPDFSAALMLADKGQTLKTSYIHYVDRPDGFTVAAEMTHRFSSFENRFTIGSSQFIDPKTVLKTRLDSQPSQSVVFLSFGSMGRFSRTQLREIAIGLEKSEQRFLWVVRSEFEEGDSGEPPSLEELLPEGFLERTKEKGIVVRDWAPQGAILSHDSVGGFVTHCGWNSVLEAVCEGVPMVAWPLYAEQKLNKVVLVEEMKVGLAVKGNKDGLVSSTELGNRVKELMFSDKGKEIRQRIFKMKIGASEAVAEGGSSIIALNRLVEVWKEH